ncbi:MAG: MCE family protein [Chitinivibrionales bacterium]|nr:MCE family protein [Chitinivibrionales bacterium]
MTMQDRRLGYIVFAVLTAFILIVGTYLIKVNFFPVQTRIICFQRIGNLRLEDPVSVRGVEIGKIRSVQARRDSVCVEIMLNRKQAIYGNYSIATIDKGLMGERIIAIDPGNASFPEIPVSDTLRGAFVPGISESVGLAWRLKEEIEKYRDLSLLFLEGQETDTPFTDKFNALVGDIDTLTLYLVTTLPEIDSQLLRHLKQIDAIAARTSIFTSQAGTIADEYREMLETFITNAASALIEIETLAGTLSQAIDTLQENEKKIWNKRIEQIHKQVRAIRKTIKKIKKRGISLRIKISF